MLLDNYQKRCILINIRQGWSSLGGRASVLAFFCGGVINIFYVFIKLYLKKIINSIIFSV